MPIYSINYMLSLLIPSIIFSLIFLFITNWFQLISFLSLVIGPKYKTSQIDDLWIKNTVKKKTGLALMDITIFHDKKMYGMMAGTPFWPKMILSEGLYKSFNKDELEWVVLHEAGHCVLWHNIQAFLIQLAFLSVGIYFLGVLQLPLFIIPIYSLLLSLLCIQFLRWGIEYMADKYSIDRVDNPMGVITAQDKFRNAPVKNLFHSEESVLRFLLHWNIYPAKRILMAEKKVNKKQQ